MKIDVIDSGIGIKEDDKDKLFRLFGFVQDAKQMNTNGIGLGLVISDQLVTKMKGKISFESQENQGSTFTFTIKLIAEEKNEVNDHQSVVKRSPSKLTFPKNSDEVFLKYKSRMAKENELERDSSFKHERFKSVREKK